MNALVWIVAIVLGFLLIIYLVCAILLIIMMFAADKDDRGCRAKSETPNRALPKGGSGTAPPRPPAQPFEGVLRDPASEDAAGRA